MGNILTFFFGKRINSIVVKKQESTYEKMLSKKKIMIKDGGIKYRDISFIVSNVEEREKEVSLYCSSSFEKIVLLLSKPIVAEKGRLSAMGIFSNLNDKCAYIELEISP